MEARPSLPPGRDWTIGEQAAGVARLKARARCQPTRVRRACLLRELADSSGGDGFVRSVSTEGRGVVEGVGPTCQQKSR
jgi:hypothetical protein